MEFLLNGKRPETVGERLEWVRSIVGLPAREVDRLAGLTENHTRAIERKYGTRIQVDTIEKIASAIGVSPSWLSFGDGDVPTEEQVRTAVEEARKKNAAAEVRT